MKSALVSMLFFAGVASCSKSTPTTAPSNSGGGATIADGIHGCQFIVGGDAYGPHRCDVGGGSLEKRSGMELFSGTLTPGADGPRLDARMSSCGDQSVPCERSFSVELRRDGAVWRGPVVPAPGPESWLLDGGTLFEIDDAAGYGGDGYGGDGYGG